MSKLTSIVELHMAFGMSYRTQHIDFTPWHEVRSDVQLQICALVLRPSWAMNALKICLLFVLAPVCTELPKHVISRRIMKQSNCYCWSVEQSA